MDHSDHVDLLKSTPIPPGSNWADLGAGSGAFTLALRQLAGPSAHIFAIDRDRSRLKVLESNYRHRFGDLAQLHIQQTDFSRGLDLPPMDGILMANSLHFFKEKVSLLQKVHGWLKPGGLFLLVEYNVDRGNPWVPYPLSFETFRQLAPQAGFSGPKLLSTHPSSFLREFYSAMARKE